MSIVREAEVFARAAHGAIKQVRKYNGERYVNHCEDVANILVKHASGPVTPEMIAAAWLHDTVEDTGVEHELILEVFGPVVAEYVENLTDVSRPEDGNRKLRKQKDLEHTAAGTVEAMTVKCADLISNMRDIVKNDPDFARVFLHEKARILAVMGQADPGLLALAYQTMEEGRAALGVR